MEQRLSANRFLWAACLTKTGGTHLHGPPPLVPALTSCCFHPSLWSTATASALSLRDCRVPFSFLSRASVSALKKKPFLASPPLRCLRRRGEAAFSSQSEAANLFSEVRDVQSPVRSHGGRKSRFCRSVASEENGLESRSLCLLRDPLTLSERSFFVSGGESSLKVALSHDGSMGRFVSHPFNRRFSLKRKPLLPVEPRNLRLLGRRRKKKRRGRGDKSSAKGIRLKRDQQGRFKGPRSRTFEGGKTPLYRRLPKWPEAWLGRRKKQMEYLNLSKVRTFIEQGRLDAKYPITQRHLHDSKCVKVRRGVHLFNVNDFPFPYQITIEVSSADQSSIDAIRRVGGTVRVVYRHPLNLRAHVKPYKFEVLPKTARPNLEAVHFLEKLRARGCEVVYVKPLWLEEEERRLSLELKELKAETVAANQEGEEPRTSQKCEAEFDSEALSKFRAKGLQWTSAFESSGRN